jgi:Zn-dependent protease with chaperone function
MNHSKTRHARRHFRTLVACLLGIAGSLPQANALDWFGGDEVAGSDKETALESVDVDKLAEREFSTNRDKNRARYLFSFPGIAGLDPFEAYANNVAQRLLTRTRLPDDLDVEVKILATDSALAVTQSDGTIWLGHAWIEHLESEDQLAFILAHEIGHIAFNHHASDWMEDTVVYAAHGALLYNQASGEMDMKEIGAVQAGCAITQDIIFPAFSREQELEADRFALDTVIAANYNPRWYQKIMDVLASSERPGAASLCSVKEPDQDETSFADKLKSAFTGDGSFVKAAFTEGQRQLAQTMQKMRKNHPKSDERKKELANWWQTHYKETSLPDIETESWETVVQHPAVQQTLTSYDRALSGGRKAKAGNGSEAAQLLRSALTQRLYRDPYIRWHFAEVRKSQGNIGPRIQNLRFARESERAGPAIDVELSKALVQAGKPGEAHAVLEQMVDEYGIVDELLPHQIRVAAAAGADNRAEILLVKCQAIHPTLAKQCQQVMPGNQSTEP